MKRCPQYFEWQKNFYIDLLNGLILDLKLAFNVIDQSDSAQKTRIPIMSSPNVNTQERKCLWIITVLEGNEGLLSLR